MFARTRILIAAGLVALGAACSNPTTGDPPPPVGPPMVTCPANVTVTSASAGQAVTYASPVTTGGTAPVTTTCLPASGAAFPVGATTVTCTARDAIQRPAVCSFTVTLVSSHLGAMNFVAFGDSITAGENGDEPPPSGISDLNPVNCGPATATAALHMAQARPSYIDIPHAYPLQLLGMLNARFPGEAFSMVNEGLRGETAKDGVGRLSPCVLMTDHPAVLLVLEGINDLAGSFNFAPKPSDEQAIVGYLRTDASRAIGAGVSFTFVSTILPVTNCTSGDSGDCRVGPSVSVDAAAANRVINETNAIIRAGIGGATIVDGNAAFLAADPTLATLVSDDGLHPTPAGYAVLAQAFMNAIVSRIPITSLRRIPR
jgi:lysophospholipase L1-like esterase